MALTHESNSAKALQSVIKVARKKYGYLETGIPKTSSSEGVADRATRYNLC